VSGQYILEGKTAVPCNDVTTWGQWFGKRVAHDQQGDVRVSTVFLGRDFSRGEGPPQLFETMIFGGEHDQYQDRYATWDAAELGHKYACKLAFGEDK